MVQLSTKKVDFRAKKVKIWAKFEWVWSENFLSGSHLPVPRSDQGHPVVRTVDSLISWQYCRGHEGCVCTQVHSLTDVCFCFIVFVHRYTPCGEFFLCELNVNPRGFSSYWRVFLTSQLDFLHILLTSSSFLSLVMGRSLFPLKPVSFSISPMQNSQACVVLLVVFKPIFEMF